MLSPRALLALASAALAASTAFGDVVTTAARRSLRQQRLLQSLAAARGPVRPSALTAATWAFTYGGVNDDSAYYIDDTADGGLLFEGHTKTYGAGGSDLWLFKLDSAGNPLWSKTYGSTADDFGTITPLGDGSFIMDGYQAGGNGQNQYWVAKLSSTGDIVWQKTYGAAGAGYEGLVPVNGGYLVYGSSMVMELPNFSFILKIFKIDTNGTVLWNQELSSTNMLMGIPQQLADGSFLFSGISMSILEQTADAWLLKLSSSGQVQWQYTYGGPGSDIGFATTTSEGGFLLVGTTQSWGTNTDPEGNSGDTWLVKLSSTGAIQWQKAYGVPGVLAGMAFPANDGGYIVSGVTGSGGSTKQDAFLAKLDTSGTIQWQKTYGGADADDEAFAFPDTTGGYFLLGETSSFGTVNGDSWIVKVDNAGAIQWQRAYGGGGDDDDVAPQRMSDGSIVLTGKTNSYGSGGDDAVVARVDSTGRLAGSCPFIHDTTATVGTLALTVTSTTASPVTLTTAPASPAVTTGAAALVTSSQTLTARDLCSGTAQLSATASASITSGTAPLSVQFTGSATGGASPYTYDWDFGDGTAHATTQSPSHTFTTAGSFKVTLTVRDAAAHTATDNHLTIQVSGSGVCTLSCSVSVAATGVPGAPVQFAATVTPSGCTGTPTYLWSFGDGSTSNQLAPTHTYAATGTYTWTFMAMLGSAIPCTANGTITVAAGQQFNAWVPSVAHASGAGGSQWRTNIAAVNRGASTASITLTYLPYDGSASIQKTASLAAGATVEWADVLAGLFGLSTGKGTVKISANLPLHVTSRTYNQATTGTFGQGYPAVTEADIIPAGQVGVIPQLKNNASFRTNVGVQNIGTSSASVEVRLFGPSGAQVGTTLTKTVAPGLYWQWDKIFELAGAGTRDIAYATVQAKTAGAKLWAYGSVVDNATGDPTTVKVLFGGGARALFVPSVAHAAGSGGSQWRTNIAGVNRSASNAVITLTYLPYDGSTPKVKNANLAPGATVEWADILVSLFGLPDGKGSVQVASTQPLYMASRTFNAAASGTFGQSYPALAEAHAIPSGKLGIIPQLRNDTSFRTNIGVQNLGTATATVDVKLFNKTGSQVGKTISLSPTAGHYAQQDKIFDAAVAGAQDLAYATLEVKTSGARVWAYGSVVDNATGDPTTVGVLVQ